jgi:hypothetical protein
MSEPNLQRVQEDLEAMKQVLGLARPFEWGHVWACLALAAAGGVVAAISAGTAIARTPVVVGSPAHWAYIALLVLPAALALGLLTALARWRTEEAPRFWCEMRGSWATAAVVVPLNLGFTVWAIRNGLSAGTLTAATLFLAGLIPLGAAIADRSKRYTLGFAVSTLLAGVIAPLARYESAGLLAGGWLILSGLSTALVMAWRLRSTNGDVPH